MKFLYDSNGKSRGECFVVLTHADQAEPMKKKYHRKTIGTRYIEVTSACTRSRDLHLHAERVLKVGEAIEEQE